jgi:hypothetical protein
MSFLRSPAGKYVLVVLGPFWQFIVEKQNSLHGFLQQGRVVRNIGVWLCATDWEGSSSSYVRFHFEWGTCLLATPGARGGCGTGWKS